MGSYVKSIFLIILSGALVVVFLTMGLAMLAAASIILPFVYWWYKRKFKKILEEAEERSKHGQSTIIDVEYEVVDEEQDNKD